MSKGQSSHRGSIGGALGATLFLLIVLSAPPVGMSVEAWRTLGVVVLMACLWIGETVPIYATALLPLVLFPLLGIAGSKVVSPAYMDRVVVLFMGGFFLARAIEKWDLHRRIALWIIAAMGASAQRLVLGFMLATAFLSMWISNTATTLMLLPVGMAIIHKLRDGDGDREAVDRFSTALVLSIAYGASIGGMGTLIGSPPNAIFAGILQRIYPEFGAISFAQWMLAAMPFVVVMLTFTYLYLTRVAFRLGNLAFDLPAKTIAQQREALGPLRGGERRVAIAFVLTALLWVFRSPIGLPFGTIPGWSQLLPWGGMIHDSTVALGITMALFFLPAGEGKGRLLDWPTAVNIPWGVLLLFGGGFALAKGVADTGLAVWIGERMQGLGGLPVILLLAIVVTMKVFLTEVTSNTSTSTIILPVIGALALSLGIHPLILMAPATLAASCAFMLPVATPPNAIIFGSGEITIPRMARCGLWLNLAAILLITLLGYLLIPVLLGIPIRLPTP